MSDFESNMKKILNQIDERMVKDINEYLNICEPERRLYLLNRFFKGFCKNCGEKLNKLERCNCLNDE